MKTKIALALVLVTTLLAAAAHFSPAPAQAAGNASHFRFSGKAAVAAWTTCPNDETNIVCTNTYIIASEQLHTPDDYALSGNSLYYSKWTYIRTDAGNWSVVSYQSGFAENVAFSINNNLTSGSVSALVPLLLCVWEGGEEICSETAPADVNVSWTGNGSLVKWRGNSTFNAEDFKLVSQDRGSSRPALAVGQVNGASPEGSPYYAYMVSTKWGSVSICHC